MFVKSYYHPFIPLTDLVRITVLITLFYYVRKIETTCPVPTVQSWKPLFIKYYVVMNLIILVGSILFYEGLATIFLSINSVMTAILIGAVYTYIREIETIIPQCTDNNIGFNFAHEFLKLYSLIHMLLVVVFILLVISIIVSGVPITKYMNIADKLKNK